MLLLRTLREPFSPSQPEHLTTGAATRKVHRFCLETAGIAGC